MKGFIKSLLALPVDAYFFNRVKRKIAAMKQGGTVFFFDIDNTIADTQGRRHLTGVAEFPKMINLVKECAEKGCIIFLSARNIITYRSTAEWLREKGIAGRAYDLIFTSKPEKKVAVLKLALQNNLDVVYYDDLCYNHENGEIKKYDKLINEIKQLDISYKGIEDFRHLHLRDA